MDGVLFKSCLINDCKALSLMKFGNLMFVLRIASKTNVYEILLIYVTLESSNIILFNELSKGSSVSFAYGK